MIAFSVYDSVAEFIASMNPQKVVEFKADPEMQHRLEVLLDREKSGGLDSEEKEELDHYILLERLIRLAKAKAQYLLSK